eukprot:jgi/Galph1/1270/GphlegSOOS_G6125.1
MQEALNTFVLINKCHNMQRKVDNLNAPVESTQKKAVKKAFQSSLSLIQGPPGTGKTVKSSTLIYRLVNKLKHLLDKQKNRIMVVKCLNVFQVMLHLREVVSSNVDHMTLHEQIRKQNVKNPAFKEFIQLLHLYEKLGS